jgi:hypothetical protein
MFSSVPTGKEWNFPPTMVQPIPSHSAQFFTRKSLNHATLYSKCPKINKETPYTKGPSCYLTHISLQLIFTVFILYELLFSYSILRIHKESLKKLLKPWGWIGSSTNGPFLWLAAANIGHSVTDLPNAELFSEWRALLLPRPGDL